MIINWLDKQVSLYKCMADNTGRPATLRDVLLTQFAVPHDWFQYFHDCKKWISDTYNDLETIIDLRTQEMSKKEQVLLKGTMQCFTPAALLETKKKGHIEEVSRTGLMQLDFDYEAIKDYDIEELKLAVFDLPFVAFCGLSCSGKGFYALVQIAEPHRLAEYAEHCFDVLKYYAVPPDTSKGRNIHDLRFVSYDCNMLIRENPEALHIKQFKSKQKPAVTFSAYGTPKQRTSLSNDKVVDKALSEIAGAGVGSRWPSVQKWSYTLGGLGDKYLLDKIKDVIKSAAQYNGEEGKYYECAEECFSAGTSQPLTKQHAI